MRRDDLIHKHTVGRLPQRRPLASPGASQNDLSVTVTSVSPWKDTEAPLAQQIPHVRSLRGVTTLYTGSRDLPVVHLGVCAL